MSDPDWLVALNAEAPRDIVFKWETVGFGVADIAGEPLRVLRAYRHLSSGHDTPLREFGANDHEARAWLAGNENAGSPSSC